MENNRSFFKRVKDESKMGFGDIFSEVARKHTKEDSARVFIAGTELTTPRESEMLAGWQKPFLFARFFGLTALVLALCYVFGEVFGHEGGYYLLMIGIPMLVPVTVLLLTWEMNIPRDISLMEVLKIVALGGILSLIATMVLGRFSDTSVTWAGLIEEPAKLIVIFFMLKRKNRIYILDGILIGMAVGTGFAIMENLFYVFRYFTGGLIAAIFDQNAATYNSMTELLNHVHEEAFSQGLFVALLRALNGICSHGMYAALYGGGLLMAKGKDEVQFFHLCKLGHLKYFAAAILLHALNNSGITFGLPVLFNGEYPSVLFLVNIIGIILFLSLLRVGVNQIVTICSAENGGRVTVAVNRKIAPPVLAGESGGIKLVCTAGSGVGQRFRCTEGQAAIIGRSSGKCNIVIAGNSNVSSVHCKVEVSGGKIMVTDLGSTNGTVVAEPGLGHETLLDAHRPTTVSGGTMIYLGGKNSAFRIEMD